MKRISLKHKQVYIACQKNLCWDLLRFAKLPLLLRYWKKQSFKRTCKCKYQQKQYQCSKKSHAYVPLSIRLKTIRFFSVASASAELGHIFCNVMLFCRFSCVFRLVFWVAFFSVICRYLFTTVKNPFLMTCLCFLVSSMNG